MKRLDELKRFEAKIVKTDGCWYWTGGKSGTGYGRFKLAGGLKLCAAHRFSYETWKGAIPPGLEIDHLCRVRLCVNPAHLEAVTRKENQIRKPARFANKTHCRQGHILAGNTYLTNKGTALRCARCAYERNREYILRQRAKSLAV